ncbi:MAG: phosphate signaling complex protein PhoU [Spirochaetota bacterium]
MEGRTHLTAQLNAMYEDTLKLSALVEEALKKALAALSMGDSQLAQTVIENDARIDELQLEIDNHCTRMLATEQPVAHDLREILAAMKISSDLERIGDHARHLAKAATNISDSAFMATIPYIQDMGELGITMVHDVITAFVDQDADKATEIAERDDELDAMHRTLYKKVLDIMRKNPEKIDKGMDIMFLNRFLERLGDHVTNMCEWVVFSKRGEHVELNK